MHNIGNAVTTDLKSGAEDEPLHSIISECRSRCKVGRLDCNTEFWVVEGSQLVSSHEAFLWLQVNGHAISGCVVYIKPCLIPSTLIDRASSLFLVSFSSLSPTFPV